jgi:hypothetical protein
VVPSRTAQLRESFGALMAAYLACVDWEDPGALNARAAVLLPGLMLARVDGKSPVEYLAEGPPRQAVRDVAIPLLLRPPPDLTAVAIAWYGRAK